MSEHEFAAEKARADRAEAELTSVLEVACKGSEQTQFDSVPVMQVAMLHRWWKQAEAAAAEMREILRLVHNHRDMTAGAELAMLLHALSTDCGKGLLTELEQLKARNQRLLHLLRQASGCLCREDYPHLLKAIEEALAANQKEQA